ncbi:putative regulatory protein cys-3 [Golovinomyces cichoracearum]|uniref:Putative regulatory protein cys-3 n=1 Tax=Golovinomyces cichoracearum TaxID=62708 RepID=A0A420HJZ9_9PEZI|nr:putative regulatory protein cys-3 [Golovinomyces cichoracearum]
MSCNSRSPDILDYISKLNTVSSETDAGSSSIDQFDLEKNLAMFSNTQFYDFDLGHDAYIQPANFKTASASNVPLHTDFSFTKFVNFPTVFDNQDTAHEGVNCAPVNTLSVPYNSNISSGCLDTFGAQHQTSSIGSPTSSTEINEMSRQAAEEDKRRRNTAASARFRIKKKQREQALERSAKEMSDKVAKFEDRIKMLETENKWLKDLITAKNNDTMRNINMNVESFWTGAEKSKKLEERSDTAFLEDTS